MPIAHMTDPNFHKLGPIVDVMVVPPKPVMEQRKGEDLAKNRLVIRALIDTGATSTSVTKEVVDQLRLVPHNRVRISHADGSAMQDLYDLGIVLPQTPLARTVQACCCKLDGMPFKALLGRDILRHCTMFYHGPAGMLTLHY